MEEKIYKLAYDYAINKKIVDEEYIDKVMDIVVDKWELNDDIEELVFFNAIEFSNNKVMVLGYDFVRKKVYVDVEKLKDYANNSAVMLSDLPDLEKYLFYNLFMTEAIIHELIHARQHKMLSSGCNNSIEARLVKASIPVTYGLDKTNSINPTNEENRKIYLENYDIAPFERFAVLGSCKTIKDVVPSNKDELFRLRFLLDHYYSFRQLSGYKQDNNQAMSPTHLYLSRTNQLQLWNEIKDEVLSLDDKLYLGLELTNEEHKEAFSRLVLK